MGLVSRSSSVSFRSIKEIVLIFGRFTGVVS